MARFGYFRHPCIVRRRKYESMAEAARATGVPEATVNYRLRHGFKGYKLLPYDGPLPTARSRMPRLPHVYADGNWYHSQVEAAEALGVSQSTISLRINSSEYPDYYVHIV